MIDVKYKKLDKDAKEPFKKYEVDAGYDLTAIWKKGTRKYIEYGTGLAFEIPVGYVGLLYPRSSVTEEDLMLKNAVGVVDASYRGEIKFRYINAVHGIFQNFRHYDPDNYPNNYNIYEYIGVTSVNDCQLEQYEVGDRCGQIVIMELPKIKLIEVNELSDTTRGTAGYGSSGKN